MLCLARKMEQQPPDSDSKPLSKSEISDFNFIPRTYETQIRRDMGRHRSKGKRYQGPLVTAFLRDMAILRQETLRQQAFAFFGQTVLEFEIPDHQSWSKI